MSSSPPEAVIPASFWFRNNLPAAVFLLHHGCVCWVSHERRDIACLPLRLLCQPGDRLCWVGLCYGCCHDCCASQARINVSAVPAAPHVFFQPLSLHRAYAGFSRQRQQRYRSLHNSTHNITQTHLSSLGIPSSSSLRIQGVGSRVSTHKHTAGCNSYSKPHRAIYPMSEKRTERGYSAKDVKDKCFLRGDDFQRFE